MGIQINGQTDTIRADDGSLILGDQVSASQVTVGLTTFHSTTAFVHNINSTGVVTATSGTFTGNLTGTTASFTGNVSVAGTLTYEDVTNVDSVGLITARNGVEITGGDLKVGTAVTISGGIVTATSYRGDGSQLTGIDASTLKDAGSVTRAQANTSGVQVTGILTATSLVGVLTTTTTNGNIDLTANGTGLIRVTENNLSQVPIVTQHDIGTNSNEIPLNQYLGTAAFQDSSNFSVGDLNVTGSVTGINASHVGTSFFYVYDNSGTAGSSSYATLGNAASSVTIYENVGSNYDGTTNKGRYTAPAAGLYRFVALTDSNSVTSGLNIAIQFFKNGSGFQRTFDNGDARRSYNNNGDADVRHGVQTSAELVCTLSANDYIECKTKYTGSPNNGSHSAHFDRRGLFIGYRLN